MATEAREGLRSLEQRRASRAWRAVRDLQGAEALRREYRSIVRQAPAMVKASGLGQTLAFLLAKEERSPEDLKKQVPQTAEGHLYRHLEDWLMDRQCPIPWPDSLRGRPLLVAVIEATSDLYRQVSREALAYLAWLKRFAEAAFGSLTDRSGA